jgi:hypothetical protein
MRIAGCAMLVAGLAACAQVYEPAIDFKGVDPDKYRADLAQCRKQVETAYPIGEALGGAIIGAAAGAAIGSAVGASSATISAATGAARGAAIGGGFGFVAGTTYGSLDEIKDLENCLRRRGYKVERWAAFPSPAPTPGSWFSPSDVTPWLASSSPPPQQPTARAGGRKK